MSQCITQMVEISQEKTTELLRELQDEINRCQNVVMTEDPVLFDSHNKIKLLNYSENYKTK